MEEQDLSHVFANEPDEGQTNHGNLPDEAVLHFARAFGHKAGISKHPGVYAGPKVTAPEDWETPQDEEGQQEINQQEKIQNLAAGMNPNIPEGNKPPSAPTGG